MIRCYLVGIYGDMNGELIAVLHGHTGGITHLHFSADGNRLYSGARKVKRKTDVLIRFISLL